MKGPKVRTAKSFIADTDSGLGGGLLHWRPKGTALARTKQRFEVIDLLGGQGPRIFGPKIFGQIVGEVPVLALGSGRKRMLP
ncbi:MAG: hypothetical protein JWQ71_3291 [Pedosphaera sp.]|nr:hypothetical protein [Pedosphaera sp.]